MIVNNQDVLEKHKGVVILRKILQAGDKSFIQKVIDLNMIPVLIQLMGDTIHPHLVLEASWCVVNLALGDSNQIDNMVANGLYKAAHKVICNPHHKIFEQAAWIVANVSIEDHRHKQEFLNLGCQYPLIEKIHHGHPENDRETLKYVVWSLSNLCRGNFTHSEKNTCILPLVKILMT